MGIAQVAGAFPRRPFTLSAYYEKRRLAVLFLGLLPLCLLSIYLLTGGGLGRVLDDMAIAQNPVEVIPTNRPAGECRRISIVSSCRVTVAYEVDGIAYERALVHVWLGSIPGEVPLQFVRHADDPSMITTRFALERQSLELMAFALFMGLAILGLVRLPLATSQALRRIQQLKGLNGRALRLRPVLLVNERRKATRLTGELPLTVLDQGRHWIFFIEPVEYRRDTPRLYLDEALRRLDLSREERRLLARAARA